MRYSCLIVLCFAFLCVLGCGKPSDLPPLAPFQVTVTKDGQPAEKIIVTVHSENLPSNYGCYGITDAKGGISLVTFTQVGKRRAFSGAPVGDIKIGLRRDGSVGLEDPREATKGMTRDESFAYAAERSKRQAENEKFVPISLADPLISPVEFTVAEKTNNEMTIELDDPKWDIKIDPKRLRKY